MTSSASRVEGLHLESEPGVVGFVLRGLGLGVDADVRCCCRSTVRVISSVIFPLAVQPFIGIGDGGFFEYVSVKRRIEALGDGVAGKEFNEKVCAIGGGDDGRPSGIGFVLVGKSAGGGDCQSGDERGFFAPVPLIETLANGLDWRACQRNGIGNKAARWIPAQSAGAKASSSFPMQVAWRC